MGRQDCKTWLCHTGANDRRSLPACENARLVDETRRTNPTTNPPTTRFLYFALQASTLSTQIRLGRFGSS
jgi:hypothetical protein